jgi:hypothetical protein
MPSIINAATSGGLISTADTSGVLQLQTASTTAMTIDASQLVGIGTTTPAYQLQVSKAGQTNLYVNNTTSGVALRMIADSANGYVQTQSNHPLILAVNNGVAAIEVNTSNNVRLYGNLGVGNTIPTTSGAGITFPATQSASSNANTLDDYEEGGWNGTVSDGTNNATMSTNGGSYTKIGNLVTVTGYFAVSSKGSLSGSLRITGLPFTVFNGTAAYAGQAFGYTNGANLTAGQNTIGIYAEYNTTYLNLTYWNATGGTLGLPATAINNNFDFILSLTYRTN